MRNLSFKPFVLSVSKYRGDNERICELNKAYFWAPALEFSTLLEVTEAGTIHVHASCTRPTRCTPVLLGFKGVKWGSKLCPYRHCRCLRHLLWGSRSGIFDVVGGNRGCSNVRLCELFMTY